MEVICRSNKINNNDNIWKELNICSPNGTADDQREIWLTHSSVIHNDTLKLTTSLQSKQVQRQRQFRSLFRSQSRLMHNVLFYEE